MVDYLEKFLISNDILKRIAKIEEFKGHWKALGRLAPDRLIALKRVATIESIGSSTRIEGAKLTNKQIEGLLSGIQVFSFRSRDEQEVAGYAKVMEMIFESWKEIDITENHIKQLHSTLLQFSEKDQRHRGNYKFLSNNVEAFDADGKSVGVVFETASPFDTPRLMETLINWTQTALNDELHHPLLVVATFIVRFLAIHPFQDGNGRLSRVLTTLLLLRAGYSYVPYSSMERIIEDNKSNYYLALRNAQTTMDSDESKHDTWIIYFLDLIAKQQEILSKKIDREKLMGSFSELDEQLLEIARNHGRLTISMALKFTNANRNTIKRHLKNLVNAERLALRGRARGTWYEYASD